MSITVIVPAPDQLLTTLARVKAEVGLTGTADDTVLSDMIARASSAIARECRRVFGRETVAETLDGSGSRLLGLERMPLVSITSVTEDGVTVVSTDYTIEDAEAGALYKATGWGRAGGYRGWGQEAFSSGYILPGVSTLRYAVTYVAGYVLPSQASPTLPGAVEQACLEAVKYWFADREGANAGDVSSVQVGNLRVGYQSSAGSGPGQHTLPTATHALLRNYRRGYA